MTADRSTEEGPADDDMARHWAAQRDAGALALAMSTGDVQAAVDHVLGMSTDEHIAVISALATDLSIALSKIHGGTENSILYLREHLHGLAERH